MTYVADVCVKVHPSSFILPIFAQLVVWVRASEMELSQRKWVEMSDYEDATNIQQTTYGPESKTEDIYQTLQSPALNVVRLEEGW